MKNHLHMWQPREFLFRKVFLQYLHTTISALALLLQKKEGVRTQTYLFSPVRPVHVPYVPGESMPRQLLETVRADFLHSLSLQLLYAATAVDFFGKSSWSNQVCWIYTVYSIQHLISNKISGIVFESDLPEGYKPNWEHGFSLSFPCHPKRYTFYICILYAYCKLQC